MSILNSEDTSKELTKANISTWMDMKEQANVLIKSRFLPPSVQTAEQALSLALAGRELGIGFMESIRSINVIQGKPTISPQLMLALANRTKELENIEIISTDEKCIVKIKRKGRTVHVNEFGVKEATELQLMAKDNYKKQKKTMFMWRALAANLRVTFPDVVLGLYTPEEMGAEVKVGENESMEIVKIEPSDTKTPEILSQPELIEEAGEAHIRKISEVQRKRFYALWKSAGKFPEEVKRKLFEAMGSTNSADITVDIYEELCDWAKGDLNIKTDAA